MNGEEAKLIHMLHIGCSYKDITNQMDSILLKHAMYIERGNQTKVAERLGLSRTTIRTKLKRAYENERANTEHNKLG